MNATTIDRLADLPTPSPTRTWQPLSHLEAYTRTVDELARQGFVIRQERSVLTDQDRDLFMRFDLTTTIRDGIHLQAGMRNSHAKRFAFGFVGGQRVEVCSNLCFWGDLKLTRKHTSGILFDLERLIETGVSRLRHHALIQGKAIDWMRETRVGDKAASDIMIQAARQKIVPWSQLKYVSDLWEDEATPEDPVNEHDLYPGTRWDLFNCFTAAMRGRFERNPLDASWRSERLHNLIVPAARSWLEGVSA